MADAYKIIRRLAAGTYGSVDLVELKNDYRTTRGHQFKKGDRAAMKTFKYTVSGEGLTDDTIKEVDILNRVNHPNVLGAYDSFSDIHGNACEGINVVLPLAVSDLTKIDRDSVTLEHLFQILCGVYYLHKNFIIHDDLKPQNILVFGDMKLDEGWVSGALRKLGEYYFGEPRPEITESNINLKIADFGLSNIVEGRDQNIESISQTLWWRPPEILRKKGGMSGIHSYESDVWALGVIFYEYSTETNPFKGNEENQTLLLINRFLRNDRWRNDPVFEIGEFRGLDELISRMLEPDPTKRITVEEAIDSNIFRKFRCPVSKMESVPWSIGVKPKMSAEDRTEVVRWMEEVIKEFKLRDRTFFLAVDIFDRLMSTDLKFQRKDYQLDAVASISLAAKLLETGELPSMRDYIWVTTKLYDARLIKNTECTITQMLEYRIFRPTLNLLFPESSVEELKRCIIQYASPNEIRESCLGPTVGGKEEESS